MFLEVFCESFPNGDSILSKSLSFQIDLLAVAECIYIPGAVF